MREYIKTAGGRKIDPTWTADHTGHILGTVNSTWVLLNASHRGVARAVSAGDRASLIRLAEQLERQEAA